MSQFNHEEQHTKLCFVFNNEKILKIFKRDFPQYRCIEVKDKAETRMRAMLDQLRNTTTHLVERQNSCILAIGNETSPEKALAAMLGFIEIDHKGYMICPECINKLILVHEDNLQTLKDLQQVLKEHAI